ncbi:DUF368 domain-containing protein [Corynebacterium otitidis]
MSQVSSLTRIVGHAVRGALIGCAELVPGVSGGTVALITGIYEKAIAQGNAVLDVLKGLATGDAKRAAAKVDWAFLAAVAVGMVGAALALSSLLVSFVEGQPRISSALFFGMVAASIWVPLSMIGPEERRGRTPLLVVLFALTAIAAFIGTGLGAAEVTDPPLVAIFFAAMVAVCALVLPGISGSFILLTLGLYQPVLQAVADRDLVVIGVFAAGALLGVVLFVRFLRFLLLRFRGQTLAVMAGLMLGSLRALWPWQTAEGDLAAPDGQQLGGILVAAAAGALVVAVIVLIDRRTRAAAPAGR